MIWQQFCFSFLIKGGMDPAVLNELPPELLAEIESTMPLCERVKMNKRKRSTVNEKPKYAEVSSDDEFDPNGECKYLSCAWGFLPPSLFFAEILIVKLFICSCKKTPASRQRQDLGTRRTGAPRFRGTSKKCAEGRSARLRKPLQRLLWWGIATTEHEWRSVEKLMFFLCWLNKMTLSGKIIFLFTSSLKQADKLWIC